jgi:FkbM family methyltransferase
MRSLSTGLDQQLDDLLAEGIKGAQEREASAFDESGDGNTPDLVLFGAGNLGRRTLARLRKIGISPLCFLDNNSARWGQAIDGIPVMSPAEGARLYGSSATFVVTVWGALGTDRMASRIAHLRQLGCKKVVSFLPLYWKYPELFLPHYTVDLPHQVHSQAGRVRPGFDLMADDVSRREYLAQLRFRLLGDFESLPAPVSGAMYFRDDLFKLSKNEVLVDCGAFDGDTLRLFLDESGNKFDRVIAFEPDPSNFAKLSELVSRLPEDVRQRITLHQAATGEINEKLMMDVGIGPSSYIGSGDLQVDSFALDSLLNDVPITFIKMDIEGSELATLKGAEKLIRKNSPILTISAYHRQSDLWDIPILIHSLNPDYAFHLRPHMLEAWDLVCYAVPGNRSTKPIDANF